MKWLQAHMAHTKTLSRPDFIQYVPITLISAMQDFSFAGNTDLRQAHTVNLDASVSVFERRIGLFTLSAFHITITDHIRWVRMVALDNETTTCSTISYCTHIHFSHDHYFDRHSVYIN